MADQFLPVAVAPKRLSQSITSSATTLTLSDINGRDDTALTMADFGAVIGYAVIEPGATNMEIVSFTGISSTSLTGLTRGLSFKTPYTTVSALQKAHPAGSKVVFSNPPQHYAKFGALDNEETVSQVWTFSAHPTQNTYSAPTSDAQFAPKLYVDTILTSGTVSNDRLTVAGTAGATLVAGNLIYLNTTDGEWYLCDADTASTVDNTLLGLAQGAGVDGGAITSGVLLKGLDTNQSSLTAGALQYASNTAGGISATVGTTEVTVGIARSATNLYFMPRFNQQITESQQDLLDGITASSTEINLTDGLTGTTALLNEATTFFNATDITGDEAETLTAGASSNASLIHYHNEYDNVLSNGQASAGKSVVHGNVGDGFTEASSSSTLERGLSLLYLSTGAAAGLYATLYKDLGANSQTFANSISLSFQAIVNSIPAGDISMGILSTAFGAAGPQDATSTVNHFAFMVQDGTLYASVAAGVTQTRSAAITWTAAQYNLFEIIFTSGVSAVFNLNGTTVATLTTNVPSSGNARWMYSAQGCGSTVVTRLLNNYTMETLFT